MAGPDAPDARSPAGATRTGRRLPFAFYGTLRSGGGAMDRLGIVDRVTHLGPCLIRGDLYAVAWYPGLVDGGHEVRADLFEVPDDLVAMIDDFEGYQPHRSAASPYRRVAVSLIEPVGDAWVYRWRGPISSGVLIPDGDWLEHTAGVPLPAVLDL